MKKCLIAILALGVNSFACGTTSDRPDTAIDSLLTEDTEVPTGDIAETVLAGTFGAESALLPDCSPLMGQLLNEEAEPGVNCIERRLYWWLAAAKSKFKAAAVIEIGEEVVQTEIKFTDPWDTPYAPAEAGFFLDSAVETVLYGEIPADPLLSCYEYIVPAMDPVPVCSAGPGGGAESWYVYKGRALAFFGDDCILQTYNESIASIYRLYPIRDDMVIDYDGSEFSLEEALTLVRDGDDEWPSHGTTVGYSICPEGMTFLSE